MAKSKPKIIYDEEDDILSMIHKDKKSKASIDIGDFVIDVDKNGFIIGLEILNASENLKLTSEQLSSLLQASMLVKYKPNYIYISLVMQLKDKEKDITIPLTVDLGHRSVSTEKTVFAAV
jgi:uncharacterized protein YuzE